MYAPVAITGGGISTNAAITFSIWDICDPAKRDLRVQFRVPVDQSSFIHGNNEGEKHSECLSESWFSGRSWRSDRENGNTGTDVESGNSRHRSQGRAGGGGSGEGVVYKAEQRKDSE